MQHKSIEPSILDQQIAHHKKIANRWTTCAVGFGLLISGLIHVMGLSLDSYDQQEKEKASHFTEGDKKIAHKVCESTRPPEEVEDCYTGILENGYKANRSTLTLLWGACVAQMLVFGGGALARNKYVKQLEKRKGIAPS